MAWFYLRNALGFCIQFGGPTALCFLPWEKTSYRFPRKLTLGCFIAALVLFSAAFPLPFALSEPSRLSLWANTYMLSVIVVCCVAYFFFIREHAIKKLLVVDFALVYAVVQYMTVSIATNLLHDDANDGVYSIVTLLCYVVSTLVYLPPMALMMGRTVKKYLKSMEARLVRREFLWVFVLSLAYIAVIVYYDTVIRETTAAEWFDEFWRIISLPFLFAVVVLFVFYWVLLKDAVRRKEEYERQRAAELQQLQYKHIMQDIENTRRLRHDMRHHLGVLYDLMRQDKREEAESYLKEVIGSTERPETEWFCKNFTINALLQNYIGRAREQGIRCAISAECGELSISPVDLTVILANALENAVRAAGEAENGFLHVKIGVIGGSLAVEVENSCAGVQFARGAHGEKFLPASAFLSGREGGGMGLKSIAAAAEKYGGEALFCYSPAQQKFTARVRLNLCPPEDRI